MSLSSIQLDAFIAVARLRNFSRAARHLGLTQPALSQRILNLENELAAVLFVREPSGVRLTERGEELLRYCQTRESLEHELLARWQSEKKGALVGHVRVGGFSTVMRSVILPALAKLVRAHPAIMLEMKARELAELPALLRRGEIDFMVLDQERDHSDLQSHLLGHEESILVETVRGGREASGAVPDTYLDHDPDDPTTRQFLRLNKLPAQKLTRSYLDDIYGLLDGVALGIGRAVVPRHLIRDRCDVRPVKGLKPLKVPVVLHYYQQPFYPTLHRAVVETLLAEAPALLA